MTTPARQDRLRLTRDVRLRDYVDADFDRLVAQWHVTNLASYPYNAEQQRHTLEGARAFFAANVVPACRMQVAVREDELVGFIALEAPWIRHFAVFPSHQRRGIGTSLLAWARAQSPDELRLFTFQRNLPARRFYDKHGFTAVAFGVSPAPESEPDVEYHWAP